MPRRVALRHSAAPIRTHCKVARRTDPGAADSYPARFRATNKNGVAPDFLAQRRDIDKDKLQTRDGSPFDLRSFSPRRYLP